MKTKEIIAIGLVTLALLAGCNKEKESTSTSTTTKSATTPASAVEPAKKPGYPRYGLHQETGSRIIVYYLPFVSVVVVVVEVDS